ncbi:MAG TPA: glycosyltransferase family 1 protein [Nitrospiraceae bacterium]|nr:glycosyltransferase family 1 protein [Nitrospiraceae bacterium]
MAVPDLGLSLSPHYLTMRILHTESSLGMGGQEYRVLQEAQGMEQRGHRVVVAAPHGSQLAVLAEQRGLEVKRTSSGNRGWITLIPTFLRMLKRAEIDVVNTHGSLDSWTASIAGRISSRRPIIIRTRHKSTPVLRTWRHRFLYGRLPHVVTTTGEAVKQELVTRMRLNPSRVISIPTGVDLERFHPRPPDASLRKSLGLRKEGPLVGAVTFLRPEKGMEMLIEAVPWLRKRFSSLECVIIGEGGEKAALADRIRALGMEHCVHLVGFRQDVPALLALLDVVVIPSFEEGLPQSLTQALAMERPVVASAVGGVPEVVEDGVNGLLVPPRDPALLAEKIASLLQNPTAACRMGKAGRQVIQERYSIEHMLTQTEQVYRRLLQSDFSVPMGGS